MRKWTYPYLEVWQNNFESWRSASTESGTSDLWQSRQRRSAEAQLHIFESSGRDEMRKWTYPYLKVLVVQVWKTNEIFRSSDRTEVRKAELQIVGSQCRAETFAEAGRHIFGSPGRVEMRKWTYPYLKALVEQVWKKNEIFRSPSRAEVWKAELLIFGSKDWAELRNRSFRPLKVLEEQSWCVETELHRVASQGRTEGWMCCD